MAYKKVLPLFLVFWKLGQPNFDGNYLLLHLGMQFNNFERNITIKVKQTVCDHDPL